MGGPSGPPLSFTAQIEIERRVSRDGADIAGLAMQAGYLLPGQQTSRRARALDVGLRSSIFSSPTISWAIPRGGRARKRPRHHCLHQQSVRRECAAVVRPRTGRSGPSRLQHRSTAHLRHDGAQGVLNKTFDPERGRRRFRPFLVPRPPIARWPDDSSGQSRLSSHHIWRQPVTLGTGRPCESVAGL